MFSFFGNKNNDAAPTTVAPSVGADLRQENGFSNTVFTQPASLAMQCQKTQVEGQPPKVSFLQNAVVDVSNMAFVAQGMPGNKAIAFINNPEELRFDLWSLDPETLSLEQMIQLGSLHPEQNKWVSYSVLDVACLSDSQLLLVVGYHNPRPKYALYRFDVELSAIKLFGNAEPNAQDLDKYFEVQQLPNGYSMVLYYSDTRRKSAEIYHNYYNHLVLYSPDNPQGVEVLKVGIDMGNVTSWFVNDKTLFMQTQDNRNPRAPKIGYWSLDLSRLMAE